MAVYRTYQCPSCEKNFDFLHHPNDEPPPSFCPLCGADVSGKKKTCKPRKVDRVLSPQKVIPMGRRTGIAKTTDDLYRRMESSSEQRMQDAADLLGCDKASLSGMKMTDMKDNLRQGDMSSSSAPADITKNLGGPVQIPGLTVGNITYQQKAQAAEYAKSTGLGPEPFAGNRAREMLTSTHEARARGVVAAGRINKS